MKNPRSTTRKTTKGKATKGKRQRRSKGRQSSMSKAARGRTIKGEATKGGTMRGRATKSKVTKGRRPTCLCFLVDCSLVVDTISSSYPLNSVKVDTVGINDGFQCCRCFRLGHRVGRVIVTVNPFDLSDFPSLV